MRNASGCTYDMVVVGAGPAGLAAAMFVARRGWRTVLVSKDLGGQLALTDHIENYPGIDCIGGREIVELMLGQAKRDGAEWRIGEVMGIERRTGELKNGERAYAVRFANGETLTTHSIILAFGLTPNDIGCAGEALFDGKGVYHSAVADAPMQDGKTVAVIGGGDAAVTAVLELASSAAKVYLIHRRTEFRAERVLLERLAGHANIEIVTPYTVAGLRGGDHVEELVLAPVPDGDGEIKNDFSPSRREGEFEGVGRALSIDAVFVQIGYSAKTKWLDGIVALNAKREVVTDRDCATSAPGIFAAGDLTDIVYKQAAISAGEGVKAALQASKYLAAAVGKSMVMIDWGAKAASGAEGVVS